MSDHENDPDSWGMGEYLTFLLVLWFASAFLTTAGTRLAKWMGWMS